jgi:hypothetical protein
MRKRAAPRDDASGGGRNSSDTHISSELMDSLVDNTTEKSGDDVVSSSVPFLANTAWETIPGKKLRKAAELNPLLAKTAALSAAASGRKGGGGGGGGGSSSLGVDDACCIEVEEVDAAMYLPLMRNALGSSASVVKTTASEPPQSEAAEEVKVSSKKGKAKSGAADAIPSSSSSSKKRKQKGAAENAATTPEKEVDEKQVEAEKEVASLRTQLGELKTQRKSGVLSEAEFEAAKNPLIKALDKATRSARKKQKQVQEKEGDGDDKDQVIAKGEDEEEEKEELQVMESLTCCLYFLFYFNFLPLLCVEKSSFFNSLSRSLNDP